VLILSITVVGVFSFRSLGVDLFPKIDLPTITVTVINPGASPQEIEPKSPTRSKARSTPSAESTNCVRFDRGRLAGLHHFRSGKNADVAARKYANKIDLVVNDLPETAEVPSSRSSTPTRRRFCVLRFPRPDRCAK